jgi:hypothetical protein
MMATDCFSSPFSIIMLLQFTRSTMLMQGLCCVRDVEGGLRFLRRAALQDEPNAMLQYAHVLEEGVLLQRSSSAAAFFLNRAMVMTQDATEGSLDHLKASILLHIILLHVTADKSASCSSLADQMSQPTL